MSAQRETTHPLRYSRWTNYNARGRACQEFIAFRVEIPPGGVYPLGIAQGRHHGPLHSSNQSESTSRMTANAKSPLDVFDAVCTDFYAPAREAAAAGRKVAGFLCSYAPQELVHAAGYLPVRVLGRMGGTPRADELLQAFACSFARSSFDAALAGEFAFLDLVVFSHTCDTMQNVADLWRRNRPDQEVLIVSLPTHTKGGPARTYFRKELERVRTRIEKIAGPISDDALRGSIALYQRQRELVQQLYAIRRECPECITGRQLLSVVVSSMLMPKEAHLELLEAFVASLDGAGSSAGSDKPRIFVAGSVCQNVGFIHALEESGCLVVDDDLCMGSRSFCLPEAPAGDLMDALTDMYLGRRPCPAFHAPGFDPGAHLVERARAARADGVVFLLTKFCDPWYFDYPHVSHSLENAGIPSLLIEVEQNLPVPAQFHTRAQAFLEMLEVRAG